MPILNGAVVPGLGPLVDLWISVSGPRWHALQQAGQSVPNIVRVRALIDTGASGTCVDDQVIAQLQLTPTGIASIHTPSTAGNPAAHLQYDVAIVVEDPQKQIHVVRFTLPVVAAGLRQQGIDALVGRDILDETVLTYNGPAKTFSWSI